MAHNPDQWKDKKVLEIAAGIGLPSLMIAPHAQTITCTDISEEAVDAMKISAQINGYENVHVQTLNWMDVPENLQADLLLLSDVNYAPADLENLKILIQRFLIKGCLVILSTPERIVARSFIQDFLSFMVKHESFPVEQETIHVYVLSKTPSGSVPR
jgi:predicted nicotinamide N-methyase